MVVFDAERSLRTWQYPHLDVRFDPAQNCLWMLMKSEPVPCFTPELLNSAIEHANQISASRGSVLVEGEPHEIQYVVTASANDGVFNLGGSLSLFREYIKYGDRAKLLAYAKQCIDGLFPIASNFGLNLTTIALVQGNALGGGFEVALASDVIVAEEQAQFGFPEILFNLFPGMGAFTLLRRRVGALQAERLILSGKTYTAAQLASMGIIDVVCAKGSGMAEISSYIRKHSKHQNGYRAVKSLRPRFEPVQYSELIAITELWVDTALRLQEKDLRVMERLFNAQTKLGAGRSAKSAAILSFGDSSNLAARPRRETGDSLAYGI